MSGNVRYSTVAAMTLLMIVISCTDARCRCIAEESQADPPGEIHVSAPGKGRQWPAPERLSLSPALFAENQGQWTDRSVRYVHDGNPVDVAVTDAGIVFQVARSGPGHKGADLRGAGFRRGPAHQDTDIHQLQFSASFVGARSVRPAGRQRARTRFHYCVGEPDTWRNNVPSCAQVVYPGLYEGIDLYVQGLRSHLKYEFHVAPGTDYRRIAVRYEGIESLSVGEDGSLIVDLGRDWGVIRDDAPYVYQEIDGRRIRLDGRFIICDERTYSFEVSGDVRADHVLVIDPNLAWSTYLGGTASDFAADVAVDTAGNVYVTGWTDSAGWVSGGFDTSYNGGYGDAFAVKLSNAGEHLWTTYLGGISRDSGNGIAVDAAGNVYVTGYTTSPGWVSGGYDTEFALSAKWEGDGFVAKLSSDGAHVWSSYLGGATHDIGEAVAVDAAGNVYVSGSTRSPGWVSGGFDTTYNGGYSDAFVVKLSNVGGHVWSTYLGGQMCESDVYITVDASDGVYVAGETDSSGWVQGGFNTTLAGQSDVFVAGLTSSGQHTWSTYLGGAGQDDVTGIAVHTTGGIYVTGYTNAGGWVSGGFDTTFNGATDAFVANLTPAGQHVWSTFLGGANQDYVYDIAVDSTGDLYVVGHISVAEGEQPPTWIGGGFDTSYNGGYYDGLVAKLTGTGSLLWSSLLGGPGDDGCSGVAVDAAGNVYVVGGTTSDTWARGGFDTSFGGEEDAFAAKISTAQGAYSPVYRFWSPTLARHFYTTSEEEKQFLIDNWPHVWTLEGLAYYALPDGSDPNSRPVYRFWSPSLTAHFYTISEDEKQFLVDTYPHVWTLEGIAFYAYLEGSQPPETVPVHRFWSETLMCHFYTISEEEKDWLISTWPHVWKYEGIAWYAYSQ